MQGKGACSADERAVALRHERETLLARQLEQFSCIRQARVQLSPRSWQPGAVIVLEPVRPEAMPDAAALDRMLDALALVPDGPDKRHVLVFDPEGRRLYPADETDETALREQELALERQALRERAGPAVRSRCCWKKMRSRKPCDRILRPCCGRPARWKKSGAIRCGSVSCLPGGTGLSCGAWPWPALSCLWPVQSRSFACVAVGLALPRLPGCPKPSCRAGQGRMAGRQATTAAYASRRKPVSGSIPGTGRPCCGTGWHRKMRRPKGRQGQREGRGRN